MAATHRNLNEMIKKNDYRRDLYYRLAVIPLTVPPLRERKEDILPLADHFLKKYSNKYKRELKTLDHTIQQMLLDHSWPGNIRELENCIEHALAMTKGPTITPSSLPVQIVAPRNGMTKSNYLSETETGIAGTANQNNQIFVSNRANLMRFDLKPWELEEKKSIEEALLRHKGNRTLTAKDLGICRATLWRKINLYQIGL
jgi:transcriptional regulator with PAS, ATPase and Fis domain